MNFPYVYTQMTNRLLSLPDQDFTSRNMKMAKELTGVQVRINVDPQIMYVWSQPTHRVIPMRFVLAELAYIIAGRGDVASIASYNKTMAKYSHDGITLAGSYGARLKAQLPRLIDRLLVDPGTRQACAVIFQEEDCLTTKPNIPCNVFLQYLLRDGALDLHVTTRSSDFVTGFSIDTLHWQALLVLMANELTQRGEPCYPRHVVYTLASLHIYTADLPTVQQWKVENYFEFDYAIKFEKPLSIVIDRCRRLFKENLSILELCHLLGISEYSRVKIEKFQEMFKTHRNKIER